MNLLILSRDTFTRQTFGFWGGVPGASNIQSPMVQPPRQEQCSVLLDSELKPDQNEVLKVAEQFIS